MKKICISIGIVLIVLIAMGIITNYIDSGRVATGHEPKYCIKIVNNDGSKVTYWGLGYKVIRYVGVSPNEPYESNIGVKMGNWFMKYKLPIDSEFNKELLWQYQKLYYDSVSYSLSVLDAFKILLLKLDDKELNYIFKNINGYDKNSIIKRVVVIIKNIKKIQKTC